MGEILLAMILYLWKCPNQKMHESESAGFLVRALPKIWNHFRKQFSYKVFFKVFFLILLIFLLLQYLQKKFNKLCPIVFSQSDLDGGTSFIINKNSEKAKHTRMCPSFSVDMGETWLRQVPIITRRFKLTDMEKSLFRDVQLGRLSFHWFLQVRRAQICDPEGLQRCGDRTVYGLPEVYQENTGTPLHANAYAHAH